MLADQPTTVNPSASRARAKPAASPPPRTIIKAILDALASLDIDHIDMPATPERVRRPCGAPSPARGRSDLLGPVPVGVGDYFHHVTVGVLEIDAATAVQMIDLAGLGAPWIGVIPDALSADAGQRRVELGVADKERVMPRTKLFARIEIEGHAVRRLDGDKMAPFRPRLEIEDIGEEFGRDPFVLRRDDRVIELDLIWSSLHDVSFYHVIGLGEETWRIGRPSLPAAPRFRE